MIGAFDTVQRAMPSAPEVEAAVLASFAIEPGLMDDHPIPLDLFYVERNRIIYGGLIHLRESGQPIDYQTLGAHLSAMGQLEAAGGYAHIAALDTQLPHLGNIGGHIATLEDRSFRRKGLELSARTTRACLDGGKDSGEILAELQALFVRLRDSAAAPTADYVGIDDVLGALVEKVDLIERNTSLGISCGIPTIDHVMGGMLPENLIVIAGRSGMGKSAIAGQFGTFQSGQGYPVLVESLEMSAQGWAVRVLSNGTGVRSRKFMRGNADEFEKRQLRDFARSAAGKPLLINDRSGRHIDKLCAGIRAHATAGRCRIVYIDHLRLIRSGAKRARTEEIAEITSTLKGLAKDLKITVVLLAQLNRNVEHRGEDAQPILSDLEGSDAIGQDADVVAFVHRKKADDRTGIPSIVDFIVCKNRDGDEGLPPGPKLLFDRSTTTFRLSEAEPRFRPEDHQ